MIAKVLQALFGRRTERRDQEDGRADRRLASTPSSPRWTASRTRPSGARRTSSGSGWPGGRRSTTCSRRPSPSAARPASAPWGSGTTTCSSSAAGPSTTGMIAEMVTGEGKTLVATLAVYLNALSGKGVHLVTVNDYLARRDAEWMQPVYEALGSDGRRHPVADDAARSASPSTRPTSPTARTASSASTTCATT